MSNGTSKSSLAHDAIRLVYISHSSSLFARVAAAVIDNTTSRQSFVFYQDDRQKDTAWHIDSKGFIFSVADPLTANPSLSSYSWYICSWIRDCLDESNDYPFATSPYLTLRKPEFDLGISCRTISSHEFLKSPNINFTLSNSFHTSHKLNQHIRVTPYLPGTELVITRSRPSTPQSRSRSWPSFKTVIHTFVTFEPSSSSRQPRNRQTGSITPSTGALQLQLNCIPSAALSRREVIQAWDIIFKAEINIWDERPEVETADHESKKYPTTRQWGRADQQRKRKGG
jgi:hypothetical protein